MKTNVHSTVVCVTLTLVALCTLTILHSSRAAQESAGEQTHQGEIAPQFTVKTLDGSTFNTAELKGKVALVNFWATWCPPCREEMPRLEKEVWQKYRGERFAMVAIAREETEDDITTFRREHDYTFPFAADPQRETYRLFASQGIPRSYVLDAKGKILYQSVGYDPEEFDEMKRVIVKELKKSRDAK